MMRKQAKTTLAVFISLVLTIPVFAQDTEEISDEQLWRYALLEEVVDQMKKDISVEINALIKAQEGMTGTRYNELSGTKGDESKLAAIEAKEWEVQFLQKTVDLKDERISAIKSVNSDLATKMVGSRGIVYKSIKEELKNNEELASRYGAIREGIKLKEQETDM